MVIETGNGVIFDGRLRFDGDTGLVICEGYPLAAILAKRYAGDPDSEDELPRVRITVEQLEENGVDSDG